MPSLPHSKHAPVLTPSKFRHLLRVTGATSQQPERNIFILWLTHTTGIRVTELGQLTISDVMFPSGKLRNEIYLRSAITKHGKPRVIYLTHPKAVESLEQWLLYRIKRQWECRPIKEYRGIWPESTVLLSHKGRAFELTRKPRLLESGIEETYWCCDALQQAISRLYRRAGIKSGSSHSGRRTLANRVLETTGNIEDVQMILGHQYIDHTWPYLNVDKNLIRRAFEIAL